MTSKTIRSLAVVASASMVLGAFIAGPAEAGKRKKKPAPSCPAATYADPATDSASRPEADAEVITVTDAATAEAPLVIEYEHGVAFWTPDQTAIQEDTKWFKIQVDSAAAGAGLNVRMEWPSPSLSDIDLYVWEGTSGAENSHSGATNAVPTNAPLVAETGAMGYESITGSPVVDCGAYLVESRAFTTGGEAMTLQLWLGEAAAAE